MNARCVHCQHSNSQHARGAVCSVSMSRSDRIGMNLCDCPRYETADQRHERVTSRMVEAFVALDAYHTAVEDLIDVLGTPQSTVSSEVMAVVRRVVEAKRILDGGNS